MMVKRMVCMVAACILLIGTIVFPVDAAEIPIAPEAGSFMNAISPLATNSFSMTISANKKSRANSSFSMVSGETITVQGAYVPSSASLDVGVVTSDGTFYYDTATDGSINISIQVSKSGSYTLQLRNNASVAVEVSGYVNY